MGGSKRERETKAAPFIAEDDIAELESELGSMLVTTFRAPPTLTPSQCRKEVSQPINMDEYVQHNNGWVYAAVRVISQGVAGTKLGLFTEQGNRRADWEMLSRSHSLSKLMRAPNPFTTYTELMESTTTFLELTGNAYWLIVRGKVPRRQGRRMRGEPKELWLLPSQNVKINKSRAKFISSYSYKEKNGCTTKSTKFKPEDIIHFKYAHTSDRYYGKSPLSAAVDTVNADEFMTRAQDHTFRNAPYPSMIVQNKGEKKRWTKTTRKLIELLLKRFMSADNQGKALVLDGDLKIDKWATEPREMDFQASTSVTRDKILAIFGVSPTVLGMLENASRSNMEAAQYAFAKWTLEPKLQLIEDRLNTFIENEWATEDIVAEFASTLPPDRDSDRKDVEMAVKAGAMTIDEVRLEYMDMDPLSKPDPSKPGSTPLVAAGVAPLFADAGLNPALGGKGAAQAAAPQPVSKSVRAAKRVTPAEFDPDTLATVLVDVEAEAVLLDEAMRKHVERLIKKGAASEAMLLDLDPDDIKISAQPYVDALNARSEKHWARTVVRANQEELRRVLEDGLKNGLSVDEIAESITESFVDGAEGRKMNIARTEVVGSMNSGALAFDESAGVAQKEWVATMDTRTRDTHRDADGQTVLIRDPFIVGDASLMYPGDASSAHPEEVCQCRCTQIGVLPEAEERSHEERRVVEVERVTGQNAEIPTILKVIRTYFRQFAVRVIEQLRLKLA
jgi:HK97 family phage portal protein